MKLFLLLFVLVSVLTVFTSNDIIILTFTPFITYFCKNAKIDPIPYLFGEFVAANTWSMALIIGNPTNIYLASSIGITFGKYIMTMLLPTLFAGATALGMLLIIFRKQLAKPIEAKSRVEKLKNKMLTLIGVVHLALCTILLIVSSYIQLEMWYITLGFAISLFTFSFIYLLLRKRSKRMLLVTFLRAPWELIPFVLSMFTLVLGLEYYNVTELLCGIIGDDFVILKYGITSFLASNVMNNIPMAVAFSSVVSHVNESELSAATFACIVGSNIGAYFTPLGALAGIMWSGILKRLGISFSFGKYISYGVRISIPVLLAALVGLIIVL